MAWLLARARVTCLRHSSSIGHVIQHGGVLAATCNKVAYNRLMTTLLELWQLESVVARWTCPPAFDSVSVEATVN